ncbi:MAG: hypothetical protein WCY37_02135 [Candidatus Dojkabacteria bacterium]
MPLFKKTKKSKRQKTKGTTNPTGRVYMPKSKTSSVRRKEKRKFNLFKKRNNRPHARRRNNRNFSRILFYTSFSLIFAGLLYASVLSVIRMRSNTTDENAEVEYVVGLDGIPSYPGSVFIFKNNVKEISVANFIATGNSAYRLPLRTTTAQAYEYYQERLPELGWENVLSVEVGSEEMKEGEYWVKGSTGLRIYSKFNDLWYETLTEEEAITGLRAKVVEETERELLLASQDYQELLPDFPWVLKVPKEYIISYSSSTYEDFRSVQFRKIGTSDSISVVPIGEAGGVLDNYLREYTELLSAGGEESWTITNTILAVTSYGRALRGSITNGPKDHDVAVVSNSYNGVVYVMDANTSGDPFLDYLFENMEPADMER